MRAPLVVLLLAALAATFTLGGAAEPPPNRKIALWAGAWRARIETIQVLMIIDGSGRFHFLPGGVDGPLGSLPLTKGRLPRGEIDDPSIVAARGSYFMPVFADTRLFYEDLFDLFDEAGQLEVAMDRTTFARFEGRFLPPGRRRS